MRILIIEDDPLMGDGLQSGLKPLGFAPDWVRDVLAARDRSKAAPTLGAAGLYLARVEYDARFDLPAPECASPHSFDAYANQDLWPDP